MGTAEGNTFMWHFWVNLLVFRGVADVGWRQDSWEGADKGEEEEENQEGENKNSSLSNT
jgi:hypothetical protein